MSTKDAGEANKCDQADDYSIVKLFLALCDTEDLVLCSSPLVLSLLCSSNFC